MDTLLDQYQSDDEDNSNQQLSDQQQQFNSDKDENQDQSVKLRQSDNQQSETQSHSQLHHHTTLHKKRKQSNNVNVANKKKKQHLSLPAPPIQLSSISAIPTEDRSLHQGRIRSFPHIEGNWAIHVFIPIPTSKQLQQLIQEAIPFIINHKQRFNLLTTEQLHISLSRTVTLRYHQIQAFVNSLTRSIENSRVAASSSSSSSLISPLSCSVTLAGLEYYTNDQRTRSFAAFSLLPSSSLTTIYQLINSVNETFTEYQLQTYYSQPQIHVTFAWKTGNIFNNNTNNTDTETTLERTEQSSIVDVNDDQQQDGSRDTSLDSSTVHSCDVLIEAVHCKIGNKLVVIRLSTT